MLSRLKTTLIFLASLLALVVLARLHSCKKITDNYKTFTIREGKHRSTNALNYSKDTVFCWNIEFDSSAIYKTVDSLNQYDINKLIASMKSDIDASTLGYPLTNALKDVKNNKILNNLYKDKLWSSFTPQIFKTTKLYESIIKTISNGYHIDDDIEAMMMNDFNCSIVRSSPDNIKVTFLEDIEVIKRLL